MQSEEKHGHLHLSFESNNLTDLLKTVLSDLTSDCLFADCLKMKYMFIQKNLFKNERGTF